VTIPWGIVEQLGLSIMGAVFENRARDTAEGAAPTSTFYACQFAR